MNFLSLAFIIIADAAYVIGPGFLLPRPAPQSQYRLFLVTDPVIQQRIGLFQAVILLFVILGLVFFAVKTVKDFKRKTAGRWLVINGAVLLVSVFLVRPAAAGFRFVLKNCSAPGMVTMANELSVPFVFEGFELRLPAGFKPYASGSVDPEDACNRGIPYSYISLIPEELSSAGRTFERFELRLGVHLNKERVSPVVFIERKNSLLEKAVKQLDVFAARDIVIAGLRGYEDEIVVDGPGGRQCLTRIILAHKERFLVISALVGGSQMIPSYREMFEAIARTAVISKQKPSKPLKSRKPAKGKIQLEEF